MWTKRKKQKDQNGQIRLAQKRPLLALIKPSEKASSMIAVLPASRKGTQNVGLQETNITWSVTSQI